MKQAIRRAFRAVGLELSRWNPDRYEHGYNARHLARFYQPRTVFDVGVAWGTPALYEAFPGARFILVEPLAEYSSAIDAIAAKYDCRVYRKAAGRSDGTLTIRVDADDPEKSSFGRRTALTSRGHATEERTVEVTTLDGIFAENPDLERPILLKLDTEGHEIEALRGATALLREVEWVLAEVSVAARFEGGYRFEDMIRFMEEHGFRVFDVLSVSHASDQPAPRHMDVMFRREP